MSPQRYGNLPRYVLLALVPIFVFTPVLAQAWEGKVVGVTDGATITVLQGRNMFDFNYIILEGDILHDFKLD